ncbi:hypothetical protein [Archaeoglobus sulfaticallidus]|uniref:hypothetical protein n=1 Tax=Archaeoglobus sulfaticallidus TaxID=1316941 RepID=UPI00064FE0F6|nr:hypothetical protein [Archaeoglobus sulfaticallidus]
MVAEWKKIETPPSPPIEERITVEELMKMSPGFELMKLDESLPYYIAVLRPLKFLIMGSTETL